ncbi:MAG: metalloregulator ArsR/SmtB family transcription factor [Pseudomonadota bacterium]
MPRAKTTLDVFSAIGEPKRRAIIEQLMLQSKSVNELVDAMDWPQPVVSKHLKVLKEVNLVSERKQGRHRYYSLQAEQLQPVHEWLHQFEKFWGGTMDQLERYLQTLQDEDNP